MGKLKNKTDFELIEQQFKYLYMNATKISMVEIVNPCRMIKKIDGTEKYYEIGKKCERITVSSYIESHKKMLDSNDYSILLNDFSIVTFYYQFDEDKQLKYCSLDFVPYYENENELINNRYIRVDYEELGHIDFHHPFSHLHFTINKNEVRLPFDHVVTPNEFLYILLVYVYHLDDKEIKLLDLKSKISLQVLSKEELKKLHIAFGSD